jgi:hypothetical protein
VCRVFGVIIGIHFLRLVSAQLRRRTAKMLMSGDGHRLWSWLANLEIDFLRRYMDDQIVRLINTVQTPPEVSVPPPRQPSRLAKTARDGALLCNHQVWVIRGLKVFMLDIGLLDVDYLCHLLETHLHPLMVAKPSALLFWVTIKADSPQLAA